jgi:drug/metabolite transporter (DMT)-like permease
MPDFPWHLSLPLLCSFMYVAAAMKLKYIARYRVSIWHISFITNLSLVLLSIPFLFIESEHSISWNNWWQPCIGGVLCLLGQLTTLVALDRGDVSIATPVLGLKIIFVVIVMAIFMHHEVTPALWIAAILSVTAVLLLQLGGNQKHHHVTFTIITSGLSAFFFALLDVYTKQMREIWGNYWFSSVFCFVLVCSAVIRHFMHEKVVVPRGAQFTLWIGVVIMAAQMLLFAYSVAKFGEPARCNIVYNIRGLWSVLAVWWIGHWYDNKEQHLERSVLFRRLFGAVLMLAAIILVIVKRLPDGTWTID